LARASSQLLPSGRKTNCNFGSSTRNTPGWEVSDNNPSSDFSLRSDLTYPNGWPRRSRASISWASSGESQPSDAEPMLTLPSKSDKAADTIDCRRPVLATMTGTDQRSTIAATATRGTPISQRRSRRKRVNRDSCCSVFLRRFALIFVLAGKRQLSMTG